MLIVDELQTQNKRARCAGGERRGRDVVPDGGEVPPAAGSVTCAAYEGKFCELAGRD